MKKLFILGFIVLMVFSLSGQTVFYGQTHTVEWDAHAPMFDSVITYEIWLDDGTPAVIAETDLLIYTADLPAEGSYVLGVRTVRTIISTGEHFYSDINWGDVNGASTPNPFELRYYVNPVAVEGFRHQ